MRTIAILTLSILLVTGLASGQDAADYEIEGLTYYFAAGSHTSGHLMMSSDATGQNQTDFEGCVHMILRDKQEKLDVGRVQVIGRLNDNYLNYDFNSFEGHLEDMDGGLAQDILVDGSRLHVGEIQHPAVFAGMAGWGTGGLYMGIHPYLDPVTGSAEYQTSMFVTPNGFRDNETGAIYNEDGGFWAPGEYAQIGDNDWEIHLRVESPPESRQADQVYRIARPESAPGYFTPNEGYAETFIFDNLRFGGTATIQVEAEAQAQPGDNSLSFTFRDPAGTVLDQVVLEPALFDNAEHTAEVPLSMFGKYSMEVKGTVALSSYDFTLVQHTPAEFDMHYWWDNVTFSRASTQTLWDCQDEVGSPVEQIETVVDREVPPPFDWVPIGFGMVAVVLAVLVSGKLAHMSLAQFRKR